MPEIIIIAAVADNRAIGYKNRLIYRLSADLKHFKHLTTGHTVLMGRKTYESLPKGALPNRRNIVVSRTVSSIEGLRRICFTFRGSFALPRSRKSVHSGRCFGLCRILSARFAVGTYLCPCHAGKCRCFFSQKSIYRTGTRRNANTTKQTRKTKSRLIS